MTKWIDKELLERRVILQQAAAKEHLPEYAVEKDWWVISTQMWCFSNIIACYTSR